VLKKRVLDPTATLQLGSMLLYKAYAPNAELFLPVVLFAKLDIP
jgi:hypothetical protein